MRFRGIRRAFPVLSSARLRKTEKAPDFCAGWRQPDGDLGAKLEEKADLCKSGNPEPPCNRGSSDRASSLQRLRAARRIETLTVARVLRRPSALGPTVTRPAQILLDDCALEGCAGPGRPAQRLEDTRPNPKRRSLSHSCFSPRQALLNGYDAVPVTTAHYRSVWGFTILSEFSPQAGAF